MWIEIGFILCFSLSTLCTEEKDLQLIEADDSRTEYNVDAGTEQPDPGVNSDVSLVKNDAVNPTPPTSYLHSTSMVDTVPIKKCKKCPKDERKWRLEDVKEKIMKKLGIRHPPQAYGRDLLASLPPVVQLIQHEQAVADKYGEQRDEGDEYGIRDDPDVSTNKIVMFAKRAPFLKQMSSDYFYFKLSPKILRNEVSNAHLWVYVQQRKVIQDTTTELNIFRVKSPDGSRDKSELIESRKIDLSSEDGGWHRFNLTHIVQDWFADEKSNWGIEVDGRDHAGNSVVVTSPFDERNPHRPILEMKTQRKHLHRAKRSTFDCPAGYLTPQCCRQQLVVNFRELGMDWVIRPVEFNAYYCTGTCPFLGRSISLVHSAILRHSDIDRCCSPTRMSMLTLLHYDEEQNIVSSRMDDIIVKSCGCS